MDSKLDIEYLDISTLTPYKNNSRTHSETQIEQIIKSIDTFGWTNPILIDENKLILAGHGRLRAAHEMGLKKVPCIEIKKLNEAQKKAYVLADNKLAENSGWDLDLLKLELQDLKNIQFDFNVIGFDAVELSEILNTHIEEESNWSDNESIIQYNIIFDNEAQQKTWFNFIKYLKIQHPKMETIGERLDEHIKNLSEENG